jgi:hypothetical protein
MPSTDSAIQVGVASCRLEETAFGGTTAATIHLDKAEGGGGCEQGYEKE